MGTISSYPLVNGPLDGTQLLAGWSNGQQVSIPVTAISDPLAAAGSATNAAAAAVSEANAAQFADQAQLGAAAQRYFPGARSYVPQGAVVGALTGLPTGSGGTNGTFDLAFDGGNFAVNPTGTFTVSGGAVTAIEITGPGIYIGNALSLPTPDFSACAGLIGAAAALTSEYLVPSGLFYITDHATDPLRSALFQNQANAAVEVQADFGPGDTALAQAWASSDSEPDPANSPGLQSAKTYAASVAGVADNFEAVTSPNLNDPSFIPPGMNTQADQVNREYNLTSGALNAQNSATFPTWLPYMSPVLQGGSTNEINLSGAPGTAFLDVAAHLPFYTSDGVFTSSATTGFTLSADKRSMTFTVPGTDPARFALNVRDFTLFSAASPMTADYAETVLNSIMVTEGSAVVPFEPFAAAGAKQPLASAFVNVFASGPCVVAVQPPYAYVRAPMQMSPDEDIVWRLLVGETPAYGGTGANKTGTIDFVGARVISRSTSAAGTIAAFNLSTQNWSNGTDERTPVHINGHYIGAGHTVDGFVFTKTPHGLTTANEGATVTDGGGRQLVIGKVIDANNVFVMSTNSGASDKWVLLTTNPTGGSLTWQSGGTSFGTISGGTFAAGQSPPILQNLTIAGYLDDVEIDLTAAGVHVGTIPRFEEHWDIPNAASVVAYQQAHVGAVDYTNASIDIQVSIDNAFVWNPWGAMTAYRTEHVLQAYSRSAGGPGDYDGVIQMQRLARTVDSTPGAMTSIFAYVPDVAPVAGLDLQAGADVTALASFLSVPASSCNDPTDPASHFAMIGKDGSGNVIGMQVYGYARTVGQSIPATRAASASVVAQISPTSGTNNISGGKHYPVLDDVALGDAAAGDVITGVAFRLYTKPTDAQLMIPAPIYTVGNKHYAVITSQQALSKKWVALAKELVGWTAKLIDNTGATLDGAIDGATVVQGPGVMMTLDSYADAVLEISA